MEKKQNLFVKVENELHSVLNQYWNGTIGEALLHGNKVMMCLQVIHNDAEVDKATFTISIDNTPKKIENN